MELLKASSCCCCINLRLAGLILGYLNVIGSILMVFKPSVGNVIFARMFAILKWLEEFVAFYSLKPTPIYFSGLWLFICGVSLWHLYGNLEIFRLRTETNWKKTICWISNLIAEKGGFHVPCGGRIVHRPHCVGRRYFCNSHYSRGVQTMVYRLYQRWFSCSWSRCLSILCHGMHYSSNSQCHHCRLTEIL